MFSQKKSFLRIVVFLFIVAEKPDGSAPLFTELLQPVEVVQGSPAKLQCRVTGVPEPTIEWFVDDEPVKEEKRIKIRFDGELCTLKFLSTELEDEGSYKCVAKNEFGSASCVSELLVNEPKMKPEFVEKMKPANVAEGEAARFDVQVDGNPLPMVEWFRGKDKLEDEGRYVMDDAEEEGRHTLIIEDAVPEDAGTYKCVASNEEGQATTKAALAVKEKMIVPEFIDDQQEASINVASGDDVGLSVCVTGKPLPSVEWYKDDQKMRKTSKLKINQKDDKVSLIILNATPDDSGTYKCVASSKAGTANCSFDVNVAGKLNPKHFYQCFTYFTVVSAHSHVSNYFVQAS